MLEVKEDIVFTNGENDIRISANGKEEYLFLEPSIITKEIQKVVKKAPKIIGEQAKNKYMILARNKSYKLLKDTLEEIKVNMKIVDTFGGKIIVALEGPCQRGTYTHDLYSIIDNTGKIIDSNMTLRGTNKWFSKYCNVFGWLTLSRTGKIHKSDDWVRLSGIAPAFIVPVRNMNNVIIYEVYNINCELVDKFQNEIEADLFIKNNPNLFKEPVEDKQREDLYLIYIANKLENYLKSFGLTNIYGKDLIELTEYACENGFNYIVNLDTDEFIRGHFTKCIELVNETSSLWVEEIQTVITAAEAFKRTRSKNGY